MKFYTAIFLAFMFCSCAITSNNFNTLAIGMTKRQAIQSLGQPVSTTSTDPSVEILNYRMSETTAEATSNIQHPYYVLIRNGLVAEFGRDHDHAERLYLQGLNQSAQPVTNINPTSYTDNMRAELRLLEELYSDDILTKGEYEKIKKKILDRY